jgi:hypothetical protein
LEELGWRLDILEWLKELGNWEKWRLVNNGKSNDNIITSDFEESKRYTWSTST